MENLQHQIKKSADKLEIFVLCPGLSKDNVIISFDKKDGILEILGEPEKSDLSEMIDLNISGKIEISSKYRSDDINLNIKNGIAVIKFGLAKDVRLIKPEQND